MTIARPLRAAIVDLDGTMVDTVGDFVVALSSMLAEIGRPGVDDDFVRRTVGKGSAYLVRAALAQADADPGGFDAALARYQHHYRAINGLHSSVYPGVVEGLDALAARGLALACLTNKPHAFALELLRRKDLARHFEHVFGGDSFARGKPDPLPVVLTCAALGTEPAATLVIGDSINDVQAARGAGCLVVLVSYGYNHGQSVAEIGADAVVDRLDAVLG